MEVSDEPGPFLIETHLRTGRPIAELARTHDVHRSWLYKLLKRYRLEGPSGPRGPLSTAASQPTW